MQKHIEKKSTIYRSTLFIISYMQFNMGDLNVKVGSDNNLLGHGMEQHGLADPSDNAGQLSFDRPGHVVK